VEEHRDLDAVARHERQSFEQLAARGDLAGQRLAHARELRVEDRERGAGEQVVDTSPAVGGAAQRTAVEALYQLHARLAHERADQPAGEMGREGFGVGVEEADELALAHTERPPHRIALAERRTVGGHQLALLHDARAGLRGDRRRAVARGRVDHEDLVENALRAQRHERRDDLPDSGRALPRGQADGHAAAAFGGHPRGRESGMVEAADFLAWGRSHRLYYLKSLPADHREQPWSALLETGRADGRLVREAREGPGAATLVEAPAGLHPALSSALARAGISSLYSHQAEAIEAAMERPTIVTTGTASGKSLCFNVPTLQALLHQPSARAIYLYPTKALAQDQARALAAFGLSKQVRPAIYDGDTPKETRAGIRRRANIVLTNPDMLHVGILPNHAAWADFLARLQAVVVDEAHVYRGVFGSHVANVLRRLLRLAAMYGSEPRVMMASATIANPVELAERLTGLEDFALVERDGSPAPERKIAIWNPPLTDEALGQRRSALGEAAELLAGLVREGARMICFMKSRKGVEVLSRLVHDDLAAEDPELADLVAPYRAGYTP